MGYKVCYEFSDGVKEEILDKVFETKEEAEEAAVEVAEDYQVGVELMREAGEIIDEATIEGWTIEKE